MHDGGGTGAELRVGVQGVSQRGQAPGAELGVVVNEQDGVGAAGEGPLDGPLIAAGIAEVGAGLEEGEVGKPGGEAIAAAVRGGVVDDEDGESGGPLCQQ